MKNLEMYGVQEMNATETKIVNGGIGGGIWYDIDAWGLYMYWMNDDGSYEGTYIEFYA